MKILNTTVVLFSTALLAIACTPTIKIEAPDKPIHLKVDVNIKQEILLKVEKDVEGVSVTPAIPLAKKAGWIGERVDGYLGLVKPNAPAEVRELLEEANEERVTRYTSIAEKHKTKRELVETVAGRRFISKSSKGEFIMTASGDWTRK
jgi:uncharacterized protein YdbL (DUF1318 family)